MNVSRLLRDNHEFSPLGATTDKPSSHSTRLHGVAKPNQRISTDSALQPFVTNFFTFEALSGECRCAGRLTGRPMTLAALVAPLPQPNVAPSEWMPVVPSSAFHRWGLCGQPDEPQHRGLAAATAGHPGLAEHGRGGDGFPGPIA